MGGSSYDRDDYDDSSSGGWGSYYDSVDHGSGSFGASYKSATKFTRTTMDASIDPTGRVLKSKAKYPIIVLLDVTGSNINFARVVYDKLPMFYGQIEQKGYLDDFEICFCAVGDAYTDDYPLQVCEFAKGIELDSWIEKLVLEGHGGGQEKESYELAAYYLAKQTVFEKGSEPIIFFIGDEAPYSILYESHVKRFEIPCEESNVEPFKLLRQKVNDNVFMLLNKYCGRYFSDDITTAWEKQLASEHVIKIGEEKAIVDLMLGIISMISSSRTLETYKVDMLNRGQTQARIAGVSSSLEKLSTTLAMVKVSGNIATNTKSTKKSDQKGKRL